MGAADGRWLQEIFKLTLQITHSNLTHATLGARASETGCGAVSGGGRGEVFAIVARRVAQHPGEGAAHLFLVAEPAGLGDGRYALSERLDPKVFRQVLGDPEFQVGEGV